MKDRFDEKTKKISLHQSNICLLITCPLSNSCYIISTVGRNTLIVVICQRGRGFKPLILLPKIYSIIDFSPVMLHPSL